MEAFAFRWALGVDGVLAALAGYGLGHADDETVEIGRVPEGERVNVTDFMVWDPFWDVSSEASAALDSWRPHLLQSGFDRRGTNAPRGCEEGERPKGQRPQVLRSLAGAGRPK